MEDPVHSIRLTARTRWIVAACGVMSAVLLLVFVACQDVTEPPRAGESGDMPKPALGAVAAPSLPADAAPVLTITNEYMDPISYPVAAMIPIPVGLPLTFCFTAEAASGGGEIQSYRYGWDVYLPGSGAWDGQSDDYDGSEVCSQPKIFTQPDLHMFTVEVTDDTGASTSISIIILYYKGPASFDIMPGTCKNPLNVERKGPVRTVLPGRIGLEADEIDASSLYLWIEGNTVEPIKTRIEDIASPMINRDPCDCPTEGSDGIDDLVIMFSAADISRALGPVSKGETREVWLRGSQLDGFNFKVKDCVTIVGNPRTGDDPAIIQRDAVLVALENGYNGLDYEKVEQILDTNFTFFFSPSDVMSGEVPFDMWGREQELIATAHLFGTDLSTGAADGKMARSLPGKSESTESVTWGLLKALAFDGSLDPATSIFVGLSFVPGEDAWITVMPPDPDSYPGEVWYQKTASYFMVFQNTDVAYLSMVRTALLTVRFSETAGHWQLIQWQDDI